MGGYGGRLKETLLKNTTPKTHVAVSFTSYMVYKVNVNVNVDLCFSLFCELVGRLKNLKRSKLYTAHVLGVEGEVGEVKSVSWGGAQTKVEVHKRKLTKRMFFHSDLLTSLTSSLTPLFFMIRRLVLRTNGIKR